MGIDGFNKIIYKLLANINLPIEKMNEIFTHGAQTKQCFDSMTKPQCLGCQINLDIMQIEAF